MAEVERAVLHEYPLPIAKCYERVVGAKDVHQRWDDLCRLASSRWSEVRTSKEGTRKGCRTGGLVEDRR